MSTDETSGGSSPQDKEVEGLRAALQAERNRRHASETKAAELTGKVDALSRQPAAKEYTRVELQEFVEGGRMSQEDADRLLETQQTRRVEKTVSENLETKFRENTLAGKITAEIERYKELKPEIMEDGSSLRQEVSDAYAYHVSLGKPENLQTELDALITVLGPAAKLQVAREKERETHQDTGSDGGGEESATGGWPKEMPAATKRYYEDLINKGVHADRKAAVEEWSYKPKNGPQR